jgi:hypothetical protein
MRVDILRFSLRLNMSMNVSRKWSTVDIPESLET